MQFVNIHAAKTHLSDYLKQVHALQDTIVICKNGTPIAQLTAYQPPRKRTLGLWKNQIVIKEDFDDLPDEWESYFK